MSTVKSTFMQFGVNLVEMQHVIAATCGTWWDFNCYTVHDVRQIQANTVHPDLNSAILRPIVYLFFYAE